jgi:hypothetical protein
MLTVIIFMTTWFVLVGFNLAVVSRMNDNKQAWERKDLDGYYFMSMTGPIFLMVWSSMRLSCLILKRVDPNIEEYKEAIESLMVKYKDLEIERDSLITSQMDEAIHTMTKEERDA